MRKTKLVAPLTTLFPVSLYHHANTVGYFPESHNRLRAHILNQVPQRQALGCNNDTPGGCAGLTDQTACLCAVFLRHTGSYQVKAATMPVVD